MRTFLCALTAFAVVQPAAGTPPGEWTPVPASQLEQARGGFTTPAGLQLSLGIERMVLLNGEIVSRSSLQIADMRAITPAEAESARAALGATNLVQNGAGNVFATSGLAGTFIQNSLNDQTIASHTVISSTVNSGSMMTGLNFNESVRDAAALRGIGSF